VADRPRETLRDDRRDLEGALREVGSRLVYPPTPDVAASVRARLAAAPVRQPPRSHRPVPRQWVFAVAFAFAVLLVGGALLVPGVRQAVADRIGLRGVEIRFVEEVRTPEGSPVGGSLLLGRRVTLEEARAAAPFPLRVPTRSGYATPDEVYLAGSGGNMAVSFVYRARADLPTTAETGIGALLTQFTGELEWDLTRGGVPVRKGVGPGTRLEAVGVNGDPAYWIEGDAHGFLYRDPAGGVREEEYRLAGNVLLWEDGEVTLRFESALTKDEAIAVAVSAEAAGPGTNGGFGR